MPKTKFQEIIFSLMMVIVMVYAMVVYNISMDMGGLSNDVFLMAFGELALMGAAAFILEMFIAGPLAKKIAFSFVTPGKDRMIAVILAISAVTVCLMCPMMSLLATVLFKGAGTQIISVWIQTTAVNFPMALCWQIFFAGPFVRWIFKRLFPEKCAAKQIGR